MCWCFGVRRVPGIFTGMGVCGMSSLFPVLEMGMLSWTCMYSMCSSGFPSPRCLGGRFFPPRLRRWCLVLVCPVVHLSSSQLVLELVAEREPDFTRTQVVVGLVSDEEVSGGRKVLEGCS